MVLDLYFGPFWDKSEVMFFQKMAICEYLILAIFSRFWLFWAHFGPEMSKVYLFQLFRCKINNKIKKSGSIWLFQKLDPQSAPKSTQDPKTPLKGLRRAKIGTNASHSVQLTTLGPKKTDLNPTPQRSVPFTWNPPIIAPSLTPSPTRLRLARLGLERSRPSPPPPMRTMFSGIFPSAVWFVLSGQTRRSLFLGRLWVYQRSDCCSRTIWAPRMLDKIGNSIPED